MKKITQKEADQAALENEEYLHSREYGLGEYDSEIGDKADFQNIDLSGLCFKESFLDEVNFRGAKLHGTEFLFCTLTSAHFYEADLEGTVFVECFMDRASLGSANCKKAQFIDCKIRDADFRGADLRDTTLWGTDLENSNLDRVKIRYRSDPGNYKNVGTTGIKKNDYVKRWLEQQAYIAEFKEYHPVLSWFWKWGLDYGRSMWFVLGWFLFTTILYGSIYSFTNLFFYERISIYTGFFQAAMMMIPFGFSRIIPNGLLGEVLFLSQGILAYGFLISIGWILVNKF